MMVFILSYEEDDYSDMIGVFTNRMRAEKARDEDYKSNEQLFDDDGVCTFNTREYSCYYIREYAVQE